ncbi:hypothetical protein ILUMI_16992 [Ignelater luminosus]|uniref:Uncharacterized protein n=1 Tax=Ignelater luminosus TaxID=2038154 RepID=A0A8K0CQ83_IGNLU|nr:hypothetical protein ILUMI_16992 [Ignelater luminosus]
MGFIHRHRNTLSLRSPEGFSLSRATSFNRHNVELFLKNLKSIHQRYPHPQFSDGSKIFNLDKAGTSIIPKTPKVLPKQEQNTATSGERGCLVTTCSIKYCEPDFLSNEVTNRSNPELYNISEQSNLASSSNQQSSTPSTSNIISPSTPGTPARKTNLTPSSR